MASVHLGEQVSKQTTTCLVTPITLIPQLCQWVRLAKPVITVTLRVHSWVELWLHFSSSGLYNTFRSMKASQWGMELPGEYLPDISMFWDASMWCLQQWVLLSGSEGYPRALSVYLGVYMTLLANDYKGSTPFPALTLVFDSQWYLAGHHLTLLWYYHAIFTNVILQYNLENTCDVDTPRRIFVFC